MKRKSVHPHGPGEHPDGGYAFFPDPREGSRGELSDELAEALGEDFVRSATSGEEMTEDVRGEFVSEEVGGPFVLLQVTTQEDLGMEEEPPNAAPPPGRPAASKRAHHS